MRIKNTEIMRGWINMDRIQSYAEYILLIETNLLEFIKTHSKLDMQNCN